MNGARYLEYVATRGAGDVCECVRLVHSCIVSVLAALISVLDISRASALAFIKVSALATALASAPDSLGSTSVFHPMP